MNDVRRLAVLLVEFQSHPAQSVAVHTVLLMTRTGPSLHARWRAGQL